VHEASLHEDNSFITLTYRDADLPGGGTLKKKDFQDFMKRLRKAILPKRIRFYHCGEYGEELGRPHYHALIFGYDFPDKLFWKEIRGNRAYTSKLLDDTWSKGYCSIGDVTFQSAAYVARYIMKKQAGKTAKKHYEKTDPETGEISTRYPEYTTMSLRPGIATEWFEKYGGDVFPEDFVVIEGKKYKTPRFYDKLLKASQGAEVLENVKALREINAVKRAADSTPERLRVREQVQLFKLRRLKRELEDET
jgi:hypothetical protein